MTPFEAQRAEIKPAVALTTPAPAQSGKTVKVELVWPAERGAKIDCRGNTKIVWTGAGDVQDYPAEKWHLLAPHPDVWKLVVDSDAQVAERARQQIVETPEGRLERLHLEQARATAQATAMTAAKDLQEAAQRRKALGAETNTDVVVGEKGPNDPPDPLSAEALADRTAAYKLATQNPQALDAAYRAKEEADEAAMERLARPAAMPAASARPVPSVLSDEQLADMNDADVHAEGAKRGYDLHPRLNRTNLRARFLEFQEEAEADRTFERKKADVSDPRDAARSAAEPPRKR